VVRGGLGGGGDRKRRHCAGDGAADESGPGDPGVLARLAQGAVGVQVVEEEVHPAHPAFQPSSLNRDRVSASLIAGSVASVAGTSPTMLRIQAA
jgi:hypothetical protein